MNTVEHVDFGHQPPPRRWPAALRFGWADLLGPIGVASVVVVVCMWLRTQGWQTTISSFDSALGSLGLLTGLVAADLMILQVIVVARIPWVERAWGHDLLMHRHRTLGYWSFWLMMVHVVLYAVERGKGAGSDWLNTQFELFILNPWFLFATLGTLILIGVVVTSIRIARKRLRYESWHLLHLYSYLGMGLAFPHMLSDGMHFHSPLAQAYWWAIYGIAVVTVLLFRLGLPAARSLYHRLRVVAVKEEAPGVVSVLVKGHRLDRLRTKSGQFFIWRFLDGRGWSRGNPYTISDAPKNDELRVTIQAAGEGSARAARLEPGTRVAIEGPYGTMTAERRTHPRMLVMAAGVGITPMRALVADTPYGRGEATLIYRYSEEEHAIFREELEGLAARRGVELHFLPGARAADGSWLPIGSGGDDVEELKRLVPDIADCDIYLCGPAPWISSVRRAAKAAGASRRQVHTEDFAW
ncbi:MAG TPA: ferredoxin reductase family protein [Solirubrobacterales bacterium]|nr:ferredoxin reductase family protein [Solirubrobacterales bacterium]